MCRAHRIIVSISAVAWIAAIVLMFVPLAVHHGSVQLILAVAAVNAGALAACLTTAAVMPYLLRDFYSGHVADYVGAFLVGWAKSQEREPDEPARLHSVG